MFRTFRRCFTSVQNLSSAQIRQASTRYTNVIEPGQTMRAREPTALDSLMEVCQNESFLTAKQWTELQQELVYNRQSKVKKLTEYNFSGQAMNMCLTHKNYRLAKSLLESLPEPNIVTMSTFLRLSAQCPEYVGENDLLSLYEKIRTQVPVLDITIGENMIHGLAATSKWQDGVALLSSLKPMGSPSTATYVALVKAAFREGDNDQGWMLAEELVTTSGRQVPDTVYHTWIDKCVEQRRREKDVNKPATSVRMSEQMFNKMLAFWSKWEEYPNTELINRVKHWMETSDVNVWQGVLTTVSASGMCTNCKQQLKPITVTPEEFTALRSAFFETVVQGKDIFLNTLPKELKQFEEFIKKFGPFDIVMDGLNVAFVAGKRPPNEQAQILLNVTHHFQAQNKRTLVIGRKHMDKWPTLDRLRSYCNVFLTDNVTRDDPYLLYAALRSGMKTKFVSRDLMRNHAFLLKADGLSEVFVRWNQSRRIHIEYVRNDGRVLLRPPVLHQTTTQFADNCWHIPYDDGTPRYSYQHPDTWLCVRDNKKQ